MRTLFVNLILAVTLLSSCHEQLNLVEDVPRCVEKEINDRLAANSSKSVLAVYRIVAGGETYYYFVADCCDQINELYDTDCNYVCAPDGGITGAGDGNCPGIFDDAASTLIWEKENQ